MDKRRLTASLLAPLKRTWTLITWRRLGFAGVPIVFGNAMPKSGSKLLLQILQGLCRIGPFVLVGTGPLRTITMDGRTRSQDEIVADLDRLKAGEVSLGYLRYTPENAAYLCRSDWATFFLLRDPRDMLVSHVFYATDMHSEHGMHETYTRLPGMAERLNIAIQGLGEGSRLPGVGERYQRMEGWLGCPEVLALHFEDFILDRQKALDAMLTHLERAGFRFALPRNEAVRRLAQAIDPQRSPTFRKGQVGGWREHFSPEHKRLFKETAGDLLIRLGYEKNNDW